MAVGGIWPEITEKLPPLDRLDPRGLTGPPVPVLIWSSGGTILTNAHVAGWSASQRSALGWTLSLTPQSRLADPRRDLASLHIHATNLPSVHAAESAQVRPGELAIAIGNPMGFVGALTTGVIHAIGPGSWIGPAYVGASRMFRLAPWQFRRPACGRAWPTDWNQYYVARRSWHWQIRVMSLLDFSPQPRMMLGLV